MSGFVFLNLKFINIKMQTAQSQEKPLRNRNKEYDKTYRKQLAEQRQNRSDEEIEMVQKQMYGENLAEAQKHCPKCQQEKPLSAFHKNRSNKDGMCDRCKTCSKNDRKEYAKKRKERSDDDVADQQRKKLKLQNGVLVKRCAQCKIEQPITEFYKCSTMTLGLTDDCITCSLENSHKQKQKVKETIMELKCGQQCANCGTTDIELLNFAHTDRKDKLKAKSGRTVHISQMAGVKAIKEEAKKTIFLCHFCHRIATAMENAQLFKRKADISHPYIAVNREFINQIKLRVKHCLKCKREVTVETLTGFDFDHLDAEAKESSVSQMMSQTSSLDRIMEEINKCQLLCANCHLKLTNERRKNATNSANLDLIIQ